MKKEKNGITLIALVVTIVVLLILASVSISMLGGENGIIKQAQDAKLETRAGDVDEIVKLWKQEHYASDYVELGTTSEEELLSKMLNDKKVFEEEIDRDNKIIIIGSKEIDYNLNNKPYDESNFVTEWEVWADGGQITLPFWGNCDMTIDWGDGTIEQYSEEKTGASIASLNGQPFHEYENAGNYLVSVYGTYDSFGTSYGSFTVGDSDKLIKVLSFGDTKFTNINFREAENLEYVAKPNDRVFSRLTSCEGMFCNCTNLQTIPEGLFASCPNVTNFSYTFYNCTNLKGKAPDIYTRTNVTSHRSCFYNCTNLENYDDIPNEWK